MKRVLLMAGVVLQLVSCGASGAKDEQVVPERRLVVDQMEQEVWLKGYPQRVVNGFTYPYVSAWYVATGSTQELVGMHPSSYSAAKFSILASLSPAVLDAATGFVQQGELNIEELLKLEPDLYLENSAFARNIEKMKELGIPAVGIKTMSQAGGDPFATMQSWIDLATSISPAADKAQLFASLSAASLEQVATIVEGIPQSEKPKVMMIHSLDERTIMVYGQGLWGNFWITKTGGIDVAATDIKGNQAVSMEQIYQWNPDIILLSNFSTAFPVDLLENQIAGQDWAPIKAIQNGQVYKIPLGVYRWSTPSGDAPLMLKWMLQTLHGERITYNMEQEIADYYQNFYGYQLNHEEIKNILQPSPEAAKSEITLYSNG
jgi:iron complex transport system substrate-binding protein